ncbi:MAG TPA: S-layer protein [Candidatus Altiarchaeales archaeon]|nr:S-layer protein [Candidatus Altiarchaeales archaeon]
MKTLKQVGSIAAGAVMLGAALSGAVSAAMDTTGLTGDFFYDSNYNPVVEIVVGEKGMATDALAAGNIAAVIGNLAYTSVAASTAGSASGQVVLGVTAQGAVGKYEQDKDHSENWLVDSNFYSKSQKLDFDPVTSNPKQYKQGSFIQYSLACDQQTRSEAGILKSGVYNNIHCLFCQTLCLGELQNPKHEMEEYIVVDWENVKWWEDGLNKRDAEEVLMYIPSDSVIYVVDTDFIPLQTIYDGGNEVDFEWRGKIILFGEEYYVKDATSKELYLAKGRVLDDVSSEGYTAQYMGYKFKIDHLIYSAEYQVAGLLLDVEKPDGTVVQTQISKMANGIVDDIEIAGVYANEADAVATASLLVYDTTTNVVLKDNKDLELGGKEYTDWRVEITDGQVQAQNSDISEYSGGGTALTLKNITVTYDTSITLGIGESLAFPSTYKLEFMGWRDSNYQDVVCSGAGNGNIMLQAVDNYQVKMSFTGEDGHSYNKVWLHQGPFGEGDQFILSGRLYEFDKFEDSDDITSIPADQARVTLKDMINGGKEAIAVYGIAGTPGDETPALFERSFTEAWSREEEVSLRYRYKADADDTDVYCTELNSNVVMAVFTDEIVFLPNTDPGACADTVANANGTLIGLLPAQIGVFRNFDVNDAALSLQVLNESAIIDAGYLAGYTVSNAGMGVDINGDSDYDDILIQFTNQQLERIVIDFYDRDYNDSVKSSHEMRVAVDDHEWGVSPAATLTKDDDSILWTPEGGDKVTASWSGDNEITAIELCHPKSIVYPTAFLGTLEETTTMDAIITKADEGTEKTLGCCTYLVKEFGVDVTTEKVAKITVNKITGGLVVSETQANTSKNLIIVGGPAVNGMAQVTEADLGGGNYVVKKIGNTIVVAGVGPADTVDAGNQLIAWLYNNIH